MQLLFDSDDPIKVDLVVDPTNQISWKLVETRVFQNSQPSSKRKATANLNVEVVVESLTGPVLKELDPVLATPQMRRDVWPQVIDNLSI
jgi:hypothetical protein